MCAVEGNTVSYLGFSNGSCSVQPALPYEGFDAFLVISLPAPITPLVSQLPFCSVLSLSTSAPLQIP